MNRLDTILKGAALGFMGAVIGWIAGFVYYFLVSVPRAQHMHPMFRDAFLCSEGQAPVVFGLIGFIVGLTRLRRKTGDGQQMLF